MPRTFAAGRRAPLLASARPVGRSDWRDSPRPVLDLLRRSAPGEILGIAGIDGNGQKQLAEALAGQRPAAGGASLLDGRPIDALDVGAAPRGAVCAT